MRHCLVCIYLCQTTWPKRLFWTGLKEMRVCAYTASKRGTRFSAGVCSVRALRRYLAYQTCCRYACALSGGFDARCLGSNPRPSNLEVPIQGTPLSSGYPPLCGPFVSCRISHTLNLPDLLCYFKRIYFA